MVLKKQVTDCYVSPNVLIVAVSILTNKWT